jgi:Kelch motif
MPFRLKIARMGAVWPARRWLWLSLLVAIALAALPHIGKGAQASRWQAAQSVGPLPPPRGQYGMAADALGHLYLFGGNAGLDKPLHDFWQYDTSSATWHALSTDGVPALIEPHIAVDGEGQVWEFGGISMLQGSHFTPDGHSFGLYVYKPALGRWSDVTPGDVQPGINWPQGREDFGFAYDSQADTLVVFAGETQGDAVLNDMWTYSLRGRIWSSVSQLYSSPDGSQIAPREIYNVSADTQGHLYLFGGTYLIPPFGAGANGYANDLWRFDDNTQTWTLLAGIPNGYDNRLPLPRHYYGQTVDAGGDFDILGGYLETPESPPFFNDDSYASYALPFEFASGTESETYGLSDFWRYNMYSGWHDESASLGPLAGFPMIPYMLVLDQQSEKLYTFGGYHITTSGTLDVSNGLWSWSGASNFGSDETATPVTQQSATIIGTPAPSPTPASTTTRPATESSPGTARITTTPTADVRPTPASTSHGAAPATAGTVSATMAAGPYTLSLTIGPPEPVYSQVEARAVHPTKGELLAGNGQPSSVPLSVSQGANHYLQLHVFSAKTGTTVSDIPVAILVTTPAGKVLQRVPAVAMQSIAVGPTDRHFGDNIALPMGHYHVAVRVNQTNTTFDVVVVSG